MKALKALWPFGQKWFMKMYKHVLLHFLLHERFKSNMTYWSRVIHESVQTFPKEDPQMTDPEVLQGRGRWFRGIWLQIDVVILTSQLSFCILSHVSQPPWDQEIYQTNMTQCVSHLFNWNKIQWFSWILLKVTVHRIQWPQVEQNARQGRWWWRLEREIRLHPAAALSLAGRRQGWEVHEDSVLHWRLVLIIILQDNLAESGDLWYFKFSTLPRFEQT